MRKLITITLLFCCLSAHADFNFSWHLDETPEGNESATIVEPVQVILLDEVVHVPSHSASLTLMRKYSVHLTADWTPALAYRLLQTFESIPQSTNNPYHSEQTIPASVWQLTNRHLHNDIEIEYHDEQRIITIASDAFTYATPLLAEIDGVRGRYFSKRLHRAVVRFATDNGADRHALDTILEKRYAVSVNVPDYTELTRHTTGEHAGRFDDFKNEELIALIAMLEEYPTGMIKTPGLKYIVRRLDGTPHPTHTQQQQSRGQARDILSLWSPLSRNRGLIQFTGSSYTRKHIFYGITYSTTQLRQDWIQVGGWYENPDDTDGWSTTKQTEFVSAYAHGKNPNEDMAESISFYIVNPDKLRSRSPAKYEFIQNRIMHGTRYISQIREDLTFQVYNLYPDYVYPGRIIRVDVQVTGEPDQDKQITVEMEIHKTSDLDAATAAYIRVFSGKESYIDIGLHPINTNGQRINAGHILRSGTIPLSRFAAHGYWITSQITLTDANQNERHSGQKDFGWQLYINNPLADCEPPIYVPNSMRLSLSDAITESGRNYQILTAEWGVIEKNEIQHVSISLNDANTETYSLFGYGKSVGYDEALNQWVVRVNLNVADYWQSGTYKAQQISMRDIAKNPQGVYFSDYTGYLSKTSVQLDEAPATIDIQTTKPDSTPPILDINQITVNAEPTHPEAPNGETLVDITFRAKDDISGIHVYTFYLRDPNGGRHHFWGDRNPGIYFQGDPTLYKTYQKTIVLPVGSIPGTWGLSEINLQDKANNTQRYDFTEIVRFEVTEDSPFDLNADGEINILDLVIVANALGESDSDADINADGIVNILDLVLVASTF